MEYKFKISKWFSHLIYPGEPNLCQIIVVPPLPGKAWKRQMPFRNDDGIFEEEFIEERRKGLEVFINKIAGHPLAQNERCLHIFLQEPVIDKSYVPGKIRNT
ncbi:sorting nexin-like isoform X1 [Aphis craccivora]|uniref:Sorting nexin-3 n=1 Tax=Aphis craccivora TaxID=307492 RepID=A0A6G0YN98_APHCR|nr:sorting nexin-like isoform X1 [Aphis craccivora]